MDWTWPRGINISFRITIVWQCKFPSLTCIIESLIQHFFLKFRIICEGKLKDNVETDKLCIDQKLLFYHNFHKRGTNMLIQETQFDKPNKDA